MSYSHWPFFKKKTKNLNFSIEQTPGPADGEFPTCSLVVLPLATSTMWKPVRPATGMKNRPATHITARLRGNRVKEYVQRPDSGHRPGVGPRVYTWRNESWALTKSDQTSSVQMKTEIGVKSSKEWCFIKDTWQWRAGGQCSADGRGWRGGRSRTRPWCEPSATAGRGRSNGSSFCRCSCSPTDSDGQSPAQVQVQKNTIIIFLNSNRTFCSIFGVVWFTPQRSCHTQSSGSTAVACRSDRWNTTSSWPGSLWSPPSCRGEHGNHRLCPRPPQLQRRTHTQTQLQCQLSAQTATNLLHFNQFNLLF